MKYLFKLTRRLAAGRTRTFLLAAALVACSKDGGVTAPAVQPVLPVDNRAASVVITPASVSGNLGETGQFTATAKNAVGVVLGGQAFTWSAADPTIVSVSASGFVSAVGVGVTTLIATAGDVTGQAQVTVAGDAVSAIAISPSAMNGRIGQVTQFRATLMGSAGSVIVGRPVVWRTDDSTVAVVDSTGKATQVGVGSATITAVSGGQTGVSHLIVANQVPDPGSVQDLSVSATTDTSATLAFTQVNDGIGQAAKYLVRFAVSPITWESATPVGLGTCAPPVAVAGNLLTVACSVLGLSSGTNYNFQVMAFRGTLGVDAAFGAVSNVAAGTTTTSPAMDLSRVATVSVSPSSSSLTVGQTAPLSAVARNANGTVLNGRTTLWATSNPSVANVSVDGVVSAVAAGSATITARVDGKSGQATLAVSAPPPAAPAPPPSPPAPPVTVSVASVSLSPSTVTLAVGASQQLTAVILDATGNALSGQSISWAASNSAIASVTQGGLVTAAAAGSVTITATSGGKSGTTSVTVPVPAAPPPAPPPAPVVATVTVAPGSASLQVGNTQQLTATARDAQGTVLSGQVVTWSTSNAAIATVSTGGLVTAVAAGSATVRATTSGLAGSSTLTVTSPPIPPPGTVTDLAVLATTDTSATLLFSQVNDGLGHAATYDIRFALAPIGFGWGSATGVSRGTCASPLAGTAISGTRTCTVFGLSASKNYNFQLVDYRVSAGVTMFGGLSNVAAGTTAAAGGALPGAPASVAVSPVSASITVGTTQPFTATVKDAQGNVLAAQTVVWSTSNAAVATVSGSGLVSGVSAGSATITATSGGKSGTAAVTVTPVPPAVVASVTLTPAATSLGVGSSQLLTATVKDAAGNVLSGQAVAWSTSNAAVASQSFGGVVTAVSAGSATITATSGGKTGSASVTVTAGPPPPVGGAVPVFYEDFSTYTAYAPDRENSGTVGLVPDLNKWYYAYSINTSKIKLDKAVGLGPSTQSIRYDYPDNGGANCGDYGIVLGAFFINGGVKHVWRESVYRWSANFNVDIGQGCGAAWKGPLSGDTGHDGRWDLQIGNGTISPGAPEPGSTMPDFNIGRDNLTLLFNGKNHSIRQEMQLSSVANVSADGLYRLWLDGALLTERLNIVTGAGHTQINVFVPNANMNQGPNNSMTKVWLLREQVFTSNPGW